MLLNRSPIEKSRQFVQRRPASIIRRKPECLLPNATTAHPKPPSFDKGIESSPDSLVQNYPRTGLVSEGGKVTPELFAFIALHTRDLVHPGELL
jgi:hypothetical protein